jgi:hypothetical protein
MYLIVIMVLIAIVTCLTGWQKADAADKLKIALVLPVKKMIIFQPGHVPRDDGICRKTCR